MFYENKNMKISCVNRVEHSDNIIHTYSYILHAVRNNKNVGSRRTKTRGAEKCEKVACEQVGSSDVKEFPFLSSANQQHQTHVRMMREEAGTVWDFIGRKSSSFALSGRRWHSFVATTVLDKYFFRNVFELSS